MKTLTSLRQINCVMCNSKLDNFGQTRKMSSLLEMLPEGKDGIGLMRYNHTLMAEVHAIMDLVQEKRVSTFS